MLIRAEDVGVDEPQIVQETAAAVSWTTQVSPMGSGTLSLRHAWPRGGRVPSVGLRQSRAGVARGRVGGPIDMDGQRLVVLVFALWIEATAAAPGGAPTAAGPQGPQDTLLGLTGGHVAIAPLPELVAQDGLSEDHLRADVQIRLLRAGIPELWEGQLPKIPGRPELKVLVQVPSHMPSPIVEAEVSLAQLVWLERAPNLKTTVAKWTAHTITAVGTASLQQRVRQQVGALVHQFVEVYRTVPRIEPLPGPWQSSP